MSFQRPTTVLVDGKNLWWASYRIKGSSRAKQTRVDYIALLRFLKQRFNVQRILYFSEDIDQAAGFHHMLKNNGYDLRLSPKGPNATHELIMTLKDLEDVQQDQDIVLVGLDSAHRKLHNTGRDPRRIGEVLIDIAENQPQRRISVVYHRSMMDKGQETRDVLGHPDIQFYDLAQDAHALLADEHADTQEQVQEQEQDVLYITNSTDIETRNTDAIVLIDSENIHCAVKDIRSMLHWSNGNGGHYPLDQKDNVQWDRFIDWMHQQYAVSVKLHILFFIQHRPTTLPVMNALQSSNPEMQIIGIRPEQSQHDPQKNRSVVDDAINTTIQQLTDTWKPDSELETSQWNGDLYVASHDGGFIKSIHALDRIRKNAGSTAKVAVVGFMEKMNSGYFQWDKDSSPIEVLDLEYDIDAFLDPIPGRATAPIRVDDYDAGRFLPDIIQHRSTP